MRRMTSGIQKACAFALACAVMIGAAASSSAEPKGAGPGEMVASGGAAQVKDGGSETSITETAVGVSAQSGISEGRMMPVEEVISADSLDVPEAAPGTGVRRVDTPQDFGLRGGMFDRPVTLDFNEQDLDNVIRLISSKGRINIIFDPADVSGVVTLHWEDVPLGVALDQILKAYGLGHVREPGNILRIVPAAQLGQLEVELSTEVIVLNWVRAPELVSTLQPFVSETGQIQANNESNSIVITDTPPSIAIIRELVSELDSPEKQVLIEMRLVDVLEDFNKAHGVDWNLFQEDEAGVSSALQGEIPVDRLGVFAPINGAFNWQFGKEVSIFGSDYLLDADIQANSVNDYARVLANPRVITLNNLEAVIRIEEQIPYIQSTTSTGSGGITTQQIVFQPAGQEITVTPTITANGYIRMQIKVDQKIFRRRIGSDPLDPPQVDEREATTNVIVSDDTSITLGGLEGHRSLNREEGVPWLKETPFFRWFFQSKNSTIGKSSLYLLVRPKIIPVDGVALTEREKYWFDSVHRSWDVPDEFFDEWDVDPETSDQ